MSSIDAREQLRADAREFGERVVAAVNAGVPEIEVMLILQATLAELQQQRDADTPG